LDDPPEEGLSVAVDAAMRQQVPECWGEREIRKGDKILEEVLKDSGNDQMLETAAKQLSQVWMVGSKPEAVYQGLESQGIGTLRVQLSGGRLAVFALADEVLSYFGDSCGNSLQKALEEFCSLEPKDLPDSFGMPSLSVAHIRTGDFVYCPCGYVCCEKTISDVGLAVRTDDCMFQFSIYSTR